MSLWSAVRLASAIPLSYKTLCENFKRGRNVETHLIKRKSQSNLFLLSKMVLCWALWRVVQKEKCKVHQLMSSSLSCVLSRRIKWLNNRRGKSLNWKNELNGRKNVRKLWILEVDIVFSLLPGHFYFTAVGGRGGSSYVTCLFHCKKHCADVFKKAEEFWQKESRLDSSFLMPLLAGITINVEFRQWQTGVRGQLPVRKRPFTEWKHEGTWRNLENTGKRLSSVLHGCICIVLIFITAGLKLFIHFWVSLISLRLSSQFAEQLFHVLQQWLVITT